MGFESQIWIISYEHLIHIDCLHSPQPISNVQNRHIKRTGDMGGVYLVWSDSLAAHLSADGAFDYARDQL